MKTPFQERKKEQETRFLFPKWAQGHSSRRNREILIFSYGSSLVQGRSRDPLISWFIKRIQNETPTYTQERPWLLRKVYSWVWGDRRSKDELCDGRSQLRKFAKIRYHYFVLVTKDMWRRWDMRDKDGECRGLIPRSDRNTEPKKVSGHTRVLRLKVQSVVTKGVQVNRI